MSDSKEYQASEDEAFGRRAGEFAGAGQGAQGTYARQAPFSQPMYAQPMYALNPVIEKIRSNASTARMFSYLSFLFGGMFLSGGMWFWADKLMEEVRLYGAPMDVAAEVERARSAAKACTIAHGVITGVILVSTFLVLIGSALIMALFATWVQAYS